MELKDQKDRKVINQYVRAGYMGNYLLDQEGLTNLDDWGGIETVREILPEEYKEIADIVQVPLLDVCLKEKNRDIARAVFRAAQDYFSMVLNALDEGTPICEHYFPISTEFISAVGAMPVSFDALGAISSVFWTNGCEAGIDRLLSEGFPDHLCGAQTGSAGFMLDGVLPRPDILLNTSAPCDASNMMYEYVAHKFNIPLIVVEAPYTKNERGLKFAIGEIKRAIEELERLTGNTLDEDKLRECCNNSNEAIKYFLKLEELRRLRPMPDPGWHRPADTIFLIQLGTPMAAAYFKSVYEAVKARADKGLGVIPEGKKEKRLAWGYAWMAYDLPFFDWLEEEHGATYTADCLTYMPFDVGLINTSSVESMIEGIAWRFMNMPMGRQTMGFSDVWVNDFVNVVKLFKADALIIAGHMACKHFWALNKLLSDEVKERTGVPTLRFEVDMFDKRFTPGPEMRRIMTEYFRSQ
jgi:benzoyl-CoA reductase/2-hydroxyglutaryl-CoA dehydratase subunit BcrC/BadD/HgdB